MGQGRLSLVWVSLDEIVMTSRQTEPTPAQMEALERALSRRRGLRQELDEIRNAHHDEAPPRDDESDDWMEHEYPIVIDIMRDAVRAVLEASDGL